MNEREKEERYEKRYRKMKERDKKMKERYKKMKKRSKKRKNEIKEMKAQLEYFNSELIPEITQHLRGMTEDHKILKNDKKEKESLENELLQRVIKENDSMSKGSSMDIDDHEGEENTSMVLASREDVSTGKELMTDSEYAPDFFDLVGGMSKKEIVAEFGKTMERHEELKKEIGGFNSRLTDIETMIGGLNSRLDGIETMISTDTKAVVESAGNGD